MKSEDPLADGKGGCRVGVRNGIGVDGGEVVDFGVSLGVGAVGDGGGGVGDGGFRGLHIKREALECDGSSLLRRRRQTRKE